DWRWISGVERIVGEQYLADLDRDVSDGQQARIDQAVDEVSKARRERVQKWAHGKDAGDRKECSQDPGREVVGKHLEAGWNAFGRELVELLDQEATDRPNDHRAEEHRHTGAHDDPGRHDRADHSTAVAVDELASRVPQED